MPSTWLTIDSNAPTFSRNTPVKEQVSQLQEYMTLLIEQLRYQLNNLDINNWNSSALKQLQQDTTSDVTSELMKIVQQFNQLSSSLASLSNRVSGIEDLGGKVTQTETDIAFIEKEQESQNKELKEIREYLEKSEMAISELDQQADAMEKEISFIQQEQEIQNDKIGDLAQAMIELESDVDLITVQQAQHRETLEHLEQSVDDLIINLDALGQSVEQIGKILQFKENSVIIGDGTKHIQLIGEVYVNGSKIEMGEGNETA